MYVTDFMTEKRIKGFIEDPSSPGKYLCNVDGCRKPTGHHNYGVCWEHYTDAPEAWRMERAAIEHAFLFDREFMADLRICHPPPVSSGRARIEIVMQGAVVRKAREIHAMRDCKPLMGDERRGHGTGEIDLGEIS
jgi:hypothetical protein